MKLFILAMLMLLSCGCTTLRPTEATPEDLQRMITHENLLEPGDRVRLVTADGAVYKFQIQKIDVADGLIIGRKDSVPIADIVAVETREVSIGKTAALTGGLVAVWVLALILAAPAFILAGA